ncbi:MAG: hypothetical protein ACOYX5_14500, partial [Actinomycetota bacterium]
MRKSKSKTHTMRDQAEEVMERLAPHVESAREKAAPVLADAKLRAAEAREKAAPYVAEAKERTTPVVEGARTKFTTEVLPVITAAVAAATEATEEAREEAKKRGAATAAALKGEVEAPKKSHKLRTFFLLLGLSGVVAFIAKKMSDREATTAWQSSYTPSPSGERSSSGTTGSPHATPSYSAPGVAATADMDDTPMGTAAAAAAAAARDEAGAGPDEAAA